MEDRKDKKAELDKKSEEMIKTLEELIEELKDLQRRAEEQGIELW